MVLLKPPYQYVFDTSAFIDLNRRYPARIFPGLWERFETMCAQHQVVAPREVFKEIKRGDDELVHWVDTQESMFLEPCEPEVEILQKVMACYSPQTLQKYSVGRWADPFVLAAGIYYGITVIHAETNLQGRERIPAIAKKFSCSCLTLVNFFEEESWSFTL